MDELQGLALLLKMKYLKEDLLERENINKRYRKNLKDSSFRFVYIRETDVSSHHLMPIFVEGKTKYTGELAKAGIEYGYHYPKLITNQEPFKPIWQGKCPRAERFCKEQISLPMFIGMLDEQIDYVSETLLSVK